ncbi:hypothetical protein KFK09_020240 [Dendrobium nobile]|uniref:Uncharacterized protein n=1 Tax=Dendrobium nobile TaxID=94219 RepID=A0A8T3AT92_DENNO|nr:hypothetical protein KFK09_020240 [Dendrobium nobile]
MEENVRTRKGNGKNKKVEEKYYASKIICSLTHDTHRRCLRRKQLPANTSVAAQPSDLAANRSPASSHAPLCIGISGSRGRTDSSPVNQLLTKRRFSLCLA